jgi:hypothetical protein
MSSKFGIGFAADLAAAGDGGIGLDGGRAISPSGASPVNSAMPKRSSDCRRRAAPLELVRA